MYLLDVVHIAHIEYTLGSSRETSRCML